MAYNLLKPVKVITAGDMSANITSSVVEIKNQDNVGIQLHWTGAPVGAIAVDLSSDHLEDIEGNVQVAGNWVPIPLNPTVSMSGTPDDAYIDLNQMSAQYMRVRYVRTSGSGTLSAVVVAKGV